MPSFVTCRVSPNVILREEEAGTRMMGVQESSCLILYSKSSRDRDLLTRRAARAVVRIRIRGSFAKQFSNDWQTFLLVRVGKSSRRITFVYK